MQLAQQNLQLDESIFVPLSGEQLSLWMAEQFEPGINLITRVFRIEGNVDIVGLRSALEKTISEHAALRARINRFSELPVQFASNHQKLPFEYLNKAENSREVLKLFLSKEFDLENMPPIEMLVIKTGIRDYILAVRFHHIFVDGVSVSIFLRDFAGYYNQKQVGGPKASFFDFCLQQTRNDIASAANYWTELYLSAVQDAKAFANCESGETAILSELLSAEIRNQIIRISAKIGTSPIVVMLVAYFQSVRCHLDKSTVVGVPFSNRNGFENSIGCFMNTLPFLFAEHKQDGRTLLLDIHQQFCRAFEYQSVSFSSIARSSPNFKYHFDTLFLLRPENTNQLNLESLKVQTFTRNRVPGKFPIVVEVVNTGSTYELNWQYLVARFTHEDIRNFHINFCKSVSSLSLEF